MHEAKSKSQAVILDSFMPFEAEGTREKRPCNVLSGVTIDRFENPFVQAQSMDHIVFDEQYRGGFQSRMNSKDCKIKECGNQMKLKPSYGMRCFQ